MDDRLDSWAPFLCGDRGTKCVQREFSPQEKKKVGPPFIQNRHVFENYEFFFSNTRKNAQFNPVVNPFVKKIGNNFLI